MKVLNLYAGIGGNRKLWQNVEVTAIERDKQIAKIYQNFFPNDKVTVADAHQYLLEHYNEFDFIWSSPPCPTHSRLCILNNAQDVKMKYPDMRLYQEIIFLRHWFNGKWLIENVISYYEPIIKPKEIARHYFWSNFDILNKKMGTGDIKRSDEYRQVKEKEISYDMSLNKYHLPIQKKHLLLKNCVNPKLGLHIFNEAFKVRQEVLV